MRNLPIYFVDAFTQKTFHGNPAAICPLDAWLPHEVMQSIAAENNLSETAFFVRSGDVFQLRWFTPALEVDLCGHATLAAAHVLVRHLGYREDVVRFTTKSGALFVKIEAEKLVLDFPARPPQACDLPPALAAGLGVWPSEVYRSRDFLAVFETEDVVRSLAPDTRALAQLDCLGVIVTAPGRETDFVSRFFAPRAGVDEDPVTGSSHCTLVPFWAERLGKQKLRAAQVSRRGGELFCERAADRVLIGGHAVTYLVGNIRL